MPVHPLGCNYFGDPANKNNLMPIDDALAFLNECISRIDTPLEEIIQFTIDHQKDVQ